MCSRDQVQQSQGSPSNMIVTQGETQTGQVGFRERETAQEIGIGAPAMVMIWTVTDTNSFPPGAGRSQTVSSWREETDCRILLICHRHTPIGSWLRPTQRKQTRTGELNRLCHPYQRMPVRHRFPTILIVWQLPCGLFNLGGLNTHNARATACQNSTPSWWAPASLYCSPFVRGRERERV